MRRIANSLLNSVMKRWNLEVVHADSKTKVLNLARRLSAYEAAVLALISDGSDIRIVVVGANDGKHNDPVYGVVRDFIADRSQMILIEPQERLHEYIRENYAFHSDTHILGCAIGPSGVLALNAIRPEFWERSQPIYAHSWPEYRAPTGITSTDRAKVVAWAMKHTKGLADPEAAVEAFEVPARNLAEALSEAGLDLAIDVLQVDAEGFDDFVIFNSDLIRTRPRLIRFESQHLPIDRLEKLIAYLTTCGYISTSSGSDVIALRTR